MSQLLSLSRAARLANVTRSQLQAKIREMDIETFEGELSVEDLLKAYPDINLEHDAVFERAQKIKANARPKSEYTDNWTPDPEILMARLHDFRHVLARTKTALNNMESLLIEVAGQLRHLVETDDPDLKNKVLQITRFLQQARDKSESTLDRKAELFAKDAIMRFIAVSARLVPSGHEFFVEGRDSLLEAALKAGLHLDYGCSSGNCGKCKLQVLQGKVSKIRDHDYVLSERELNEGYCLACSNTAVSDVLLQAHEALTADDLPRQEIRCQVKNMQPVDNRLLLLSVKTPRTKTFRFMAGQHVIMTLENSMQKKLPVASCPCDGLNLQFLLSIEQNGDFEQALLSGSKEQTVLIQGPEGNFLLQEDAIDPVVFISVNAGFAAIKSLIEHAIAIDNAICMSLYRIDAVAEKSLVGNLCRSWDDALDNFYYQRLDVQATPEQVIRKIASSGRKLTDNRFYVAGPAAWINAFKSLAFEQGVQTENLQSYIVEE